MPNIDRVVKMSYFKKISDSQSNHIRSVYNIGDAESVTFDIEKEPTTDIEVCNQVVKYLSEAFPHNKVMGMYNGVELSVIREE